ncbi:hypothetical protein GTW66_17850 [Streptomyces sp. SID5473]|nr:hypothetical protein [Streptomyces sp. SID5473]MYS65833.1 hypothetical protein [Streptomyces sp. SID5473]
MSDTAATAGAGERTAGSAGPVGAAGLIPAPVSVTAVPDGGAFTPDSATS